MYLSCVTTCFNFHVRASHHWISPEWSAFCPPTRRALLSGEKATDQGCVSPSLSVRSSAPVPAFHSLTVFWPGSPAATNLPSGDKATQTSCESPLNVCFKAKVLASHTLTTSRNRSMF